MRLKKDTFKKVDELADAETIIVSNTSGLSISEIASVTNRPDKVMGAHFFYPAPVMKLLELVRGLVTSDETYDVVKEFAGKIGKTTVDAPEFPGFMVNRILVPMQNEAAFMVMEGSKPEDVDNAMKLGCNHPMGPIELTDFVGIDTMLATMTGLYNGFHDSKYRPCPLLETMVKSGMLGKKTGQGFFEGRNGQMHWKNYINDAKEENDTAIQRTGDLVSSLGTQIEKIDDKISQLESRIKYKRSLI